MQEISKPSLRRAARAAFAGCRNCVRELDRLHERSIRWESAETVRSDATRRSLPQSAEWNEGMRVLLYNFLQPDEDGAGGVGVYMRNLTRTLIAEGNNVITLSSGSEYTFGKRKPYLRGWSTDHQCAAIVNSPMIAPALYSFDEPGRYLESTALDSIPNELAKRYGAIDVFHFQNVEGLTHSFFRALKGTFPEAKLILSVHNYHTVCPRVSLWFQDRVVCEDYREGAACTVCEAPRFDRRRVLNTLRLRTLKQRTPKIAGVVGSVMPLVRSLRRLRSLRRPQFTMGSAATSTGSTQSPAPAFKAFRQSNVELLSHVFDKTLAVSQRTRQIMIRYGVSPDRVAVSYIGTAYKDSFLTSRKIMDIGDGLHLCYMGYMWRNKGFEFLLDALEDLSSRAAAAISVTFAAKNTNEEWLRRVHALAGKYKEVRYFDGYTHTNMDEVLAGVNLGIVPVLWEDNLPQIAIELISRGIPILTSDRGGASEIARDHRFTYIAESLSDVTDRLCRISDRRLPLTEFWENQMQLFSMAEHVRDLSGYYRAA